MEQQVCLITGGGTGIGAATAKALAGTGSYVHLVGRRAGPLQTVADDIRSSGAHAEAHACDVREAEALASLTSDLVDRYGHVDVLVANAATYDAATVDRGDPERWQAMVDTNVLGVLFACRAVLPHMLERHDGHLVIVSSVSGRVTYGRETVYAATKHATVGLGDSLRQEVGSRGIRVTIIEPGMVDTPMLGNPCGLEPSDRVRPLDPDDVARAIAFAIEQPAHCSINEIVLRPTAQVV